MKPGVIGFTLFFYIPWLKTYITIAYSDIIIANPDIIIAYSDIMIANGNMLMADPLSGVNR